MKWKWKGGNCGELPRCMQELRHLMVRQCTYAWLFLKGLYYIILLVGPNFKGGGGPKLDELLTYHKWRIWKWGSWDGVISQPAVFGSRTAPKQLPNSSRTAPFQLMKLDNIRGYPFRGFKSIGLELDICQTKLLNQFFSFQLKVWHWRKWIA